MITIIVMWRTTKC